MQLIPGRRARNHWYNPYRSTFNGIQRHKQDNLACLGPLEEAVRESSSLKLKDTAASRIDRQRKGHFSTRRRETAIVWHFCHLISINKSLSLETGKGGYGASEATANNFRTVSKLVCYSGLVSLLSFLGVFWEAGGWILTPQMPLFYSVDTNHYFPCQLSYILIPLCLANQPDYLIWVCRQRLGTLNISKLLFFCNWSYYVIGTS